VMVPFRVLDRNSAVTVRLRLVACSPFTMLWVAGPGSPRVNRYVPSVSRLSLRIKAKQHQLMRDQKGAFVRKLCL
jgi:hypothetical protein